MITLEFLLTVGVLAALSQFNILTDPFKAAFTRPGQNAANDQNKRNATAAGYGLDILKASMPNTLKQIDYANSLEPARQNNINDTLLLASPGNMQATAKKQVGAINQELNDTVHNLGQQFDSEGFSDGAKAGAIADATNSAAEQKNAVMANINDPTYLAQLHQLLLGVVNQGQQIPGLNTVGMGANIVSNQPAVPVGGGIGELVGQIGAGWASSGFATPK